MELWVRSQNREMLVLSPKLSIEKVEEKFYIVEIYNFENSTILGTYKSKERALEVLDEIQNIIYFNKLFNNDAEVFRLCLEKEMNATEEQMNELLKQMSVYEMPGE